MHRYWASVRRVRGGDKRFRDSSQEASAFKMEHKAQIESAFIGLRCTTVTRFSADSLRFDFEGRTVLDVRCPWRILSATGIALGNVDHQQQFGLPTPIEAQQEAQKLLADRIVKATIREKTADLILELEQGVV